MLSLCLSLSLLFLLSSASLLSLVLYSDNTPSSLLSELSDSVYRNPDLNLVFRKFSDSLLLDLDLEREFVNLVFDYTSSVVFSLQVKEYCSSRSLLYFSPVPSPLGKWTFLLHPSPSTEAAAIQLYLKHLNWTSFHILSSQKAPHKTIYRSLSSEVLYVISNSAHQEVYDDFTGKIVKPSGNWKSVVVSDGQGVSKHIQSLQNLRIYKERCAFITNSQGSWGVRKEGGLSVVEEGLEGAESEGEYEFKAIKRVLTLLKNHLGETRKYVKNDELLKYLEEISENRVVSSNYSIVNFTPFPKIVATLHKNRVVEREERTVFPGNVTELNNSPPIVEISGNLVPIEFDGSTNPISYFMSLGVLPMIGIINADPTILTNFELQIHSTDCGQTYFNHNFASECLKRHYDRLGAFYVNSGYEEIGQGYISLFREKNIHIPHTGVFYSSPESFDKELYPELYIPTANLIYIQSILPYILNSFRWNQIIAIFIDGEPQSSIDVFFHNARVLNIEIMNDKDHMFLPWTLNQTEYLENVKQMAQYLYDTKCRIFVLLINAPFNAYFLQGLYDFGFRPGDIVAVSRSLIGELIENSGFYGHDNEKVLPLLDGSIALFNNEYIGEYGEHLEKTISQIIYPQPTAYTCFQVDALLLGVHTIDLMINIGRDYEDPEDMNYFMRQERFTGCSGIVSIGSEGNGRSELSYTLYNFYVTGQGENGPEWREYKAGNYTIGTNIPLKISKDIVWPRGETVPPDDMREDPECGFSEDQVQKNDNSIYLLISFSVFHFVFIVLTGGLIWKKLFDFEYEELSKKEEMWMEDGIILALPGIETCQYVWLGPDIRPINPVFGFIGSVFSLDIEMFHKFTPEEFWTSVYMILGVTSFWILCVILFLSTCYRSLNKYFRKPIVVLAYRMSPLFAKVSFIGIISILLRLFECKEGTGSSITSSFLKNDCRTSCWEGSHLYMAIFGFVVLILYTLVCILINSTTEFLMDYSNVKTFPLFSFLKTVFNLLLILLKFNLKSEFQVLHSTVCLCLFVLWTIVVFKIKPYNYERLDFWQRLTLCGMCFYFLTMVIYEAIGGGEMEIMIVQIVAMICLIALGFVVQYKWFPSMLYRKKGRNFDKQLKFAFRWNQGVKGLTQHKLDYRTQDKEENSHRAEIKYRSNRDRTIETNVQNRFNTVR